MISVYTEGDRCKKCYSCVRSCPTKAIQVHGGQADILEEYCISCGHCVAVCSQGAKMVESAVDRVIGLLEGEDGSFDSSNRVFAMVAPSFPAAFLGTEPERLVGALKQVGFSGVFEVAFGADLVSYEYYKRYRSLLKESEGSFIISTPCPAIMYYVEKIYPELTPYLARIVSPMEAMARVIRQTVDAHGRIVFIGPCAAKKDEARELEDVDAVLTFSELRELFSKKGLMPSDARSADFDEPHANLGKIYPVTGGLLKAACISSDLLESPVNVVEGPERVSDILKVLSGRVRTGDKAHYRLYDLLFCEGCIGGPFMMNDLTFYERKKYIVDYIRRRPVVHNIEEWARLHENYLRIDLSRDFHSLKKEVREPPEEEIKKILAMTNKLRLEDELNCGACGYVSCRAKAVAVYKGMAEVEMCLPYLISKIEKTLDDLKENQTKLIQAEKLASMGQMAAGIAHEINNPLGVVLMYSHLLKDELDGNAQATEDLTRIIGEAERTRNIVRGILNFARQEKVDRRSTDVNEVVKQSLTGVLKSFPEGQYREALELDPGLEPQMVDLSQLRQVFDNVIKNACEAMPGGGVVTIKTERVDDGFSVSVSDTGRGIPEDNLSKIFSPFFTTKPVGKGTGLGLSVCYGIVKMHGGSIEARNNPGGGACFTIKINKYLETADAKNTHS
jgi:iron only hydrogenase large subunit-like protein/nitrogen-specific signal transduction histidine kinase